MKLLNNDQINLVSGGELTLKDQSAEQRCIVAKAKWFDRLLSSVVEGDKVICTYTVSPYVSPNNKYFGKETGTTILSTKGMYL